MIGANSTRGAQAVGWMRIAAEAALAMAKLNLGLSPRCARRSPDAPGRAQC